MLDYQTARGMIIGLEAFRGHDPEEYSALVEPLSQFVFSNKFYNLSEVNKLVKAILAATPETTTADIEAPVTTRFRADQVKPWIEDIRQTLFHSITAPFDSIKDAQTWWNETDKRFDDWNKKIDEWQKRTDKWLKRAEEYRSVFEDMKVKYPKGIPVDFSDPEWQRLDEIESSLEPLHVADPPEQDEQVKVTLSSVHEILEINNVTGFTLESIAMNILADAKLVLPAFTFGIVRKTHSVPGGKSILNSFARVTIRGELTFEDLRSLYRGIRRELGIKRSKCPTTKQLQIYEMVQERGGVPTGKGKVAFWESLRHEWSKKHPKDKCTTWQGVKVVYDRFCRRMNDRFQGKYQKEGQANERPHSKEG